MRTIVAAIAIAAATLAWSCAGEEIIDVPSFGQVTSEPRVLGSTDVLVHVGNDLGVAQEGARVVVELASGVPLEAVTDELGFAVFEEVREDVVGVLAYREGHRFAAVIGHRLERDSLRHALRIDLELTPLEARVDETPTVRIWGPVPQTEGEWLIVGADQPGSSTFHQFRPTSYELEVPAGEPLRIIAASYRVTDGGFVTSPSFVHKTVGPLYDERTRIDLSDAESLPTTRFEGSIELREPTGWPMTEELGYVPQIEVRAVPSQGSAVLGLPTVLRRRSDRYYAFEGLYAEVPGLDVYTEYRAVLSHEPPEAPWLDGAPNVPRADRDEGDAALASQRALGPPSSGEVVLPVIPTMTVAGVSIRHKGVQVDPYPNRATLTLEVGARGAMTGSIEVADDRTHIYCPPLPSGVSVEELFDGNLTEVRLTSCERPIPQLDGMCARWASTPTHNIGP